MKEDKQDKTRQATMLTKKKKYRGACGHNTPSKSWGKTRPSKSWVNLGNPVKAGEKVDGPQKTSLHAQNVSII